MRGQAKIDTREPTVKADNRTALAEIRARAAESTIATRTATVQWETT